MEGPPRASRLAPLTLAALLAPAGTTSAAPPMTEWKITLEGESLAGCTRDRFTDLCADAGGLCLAPSWLIADAMARSSKIRESLTPEVEAKKLFDLPAAVASAEVLFHGGGGTEEEPLLITVNGREIRHVQDRERMLTGGWDRETIPGRWLRPGTNELVFSGAGSLVIDADGPGRNSFKRLGGRGEWKGDMLGAGNDLTGEYVVRLRVRSHPQEGVATSPVLDLAAGPAVAPGMEVKALRLSAAPETPPGTSVRFEVRSGSTALYASDEWTSWRPADSGEALPGGRFVQWRAFLSSGDPAVTPVVKGVTIEASGRAVGANLPRIEVVQAPENDLAVSSYPFDYADPHHPRMRHLREKYRLKEVVAPGQTEMERFALLREWVRRQWEGWNDNEYNYCPQWDALEILELAPQNLALGMCTHYAAVFSQCAGALGYHARPLIVDHHCLAEIWSDEHGKWILQDPGLLPGHEVAFQYEEAGVPINALEMHHLAAAGRMEDLEFVPLPPVPDERLRTMFAQLYQRFGMPLRNDHLYRPEPQELEQGMDQYHWDGHLWWTDSLDPRYPEYSLQTNRPEDFYWDLNRTRIDLQDTETAAALAVRLSGPIPHLDRFEVSVDRGEWQESEPSFEWELRPGRNRLRARAVNTMGLKGPENRVELEYRPG